MRKVHALPASTATGAAPKAQASLAMYIVVLHAEERVAELTAVEPVVPCGRVDRESHRPACAREVHGAFVIEVEEFQVASGVGGGEVNLKPVRARPTAQRANATQRVLLERAHVRILVEPVRVAHKVGPRRLTEAGAHVLGEA